MNKLLYLVIYCQIYNIYCNNNRPTITCEFGIITVLLSAVFNACIFVSAISSSLRQETVDNFMKARNIRPIQYSIQPLIQYRFWFNTTFRIQNRMLEKLFSKLKFILRIVTPKTMMMIIFTVLNGLKVFIHLRWNLQN